MMKPETIGLAARLPEFACRLQHIECTGDIRVDEI